MFPAPVGAKHNLYRPYRGIDKWGRFSHGWRRGLPCAAATRLNAPTHTCPAPRLNALAHSCTIPLLLPTRRLLLGGWLPGCHLRVQLE